MKATERREFSQILAATMELYGASLSPAATGLWWAALERYSIAQVREALSRHVQDPTGGRYVPRPADVVGVILQADGRPGVEEAWSMVPRDEIDTVVWTDEMSEAWGVALPLLNEGDPIAARMAFKERYEALVREARRLGKPPRWTPSLGTSAHGRETAIAEAVAKGRLSSEHAMRLLPDFSEENVLPFLPERRATLISGSRE
jgi:hypothetical protein